MLPGQQNTAEATEDEAQIKAPAAETDSVIKGNPPLTHTDVLLCQWLCSEGTQKDQKPLYGN